MLNFHFHSAKSTFLRLIPIRARVWLSLARELRATAEKPLTQFTHTSHSQCNQERPIFDVKKKRKKNNIYRVARWVEAHNRRVLRFEEEKKELTMEIEIIVCIFSTSSFLSAVGLLFYYFFIRIAVLHRNSTFHIHPTWQANAGHVPHLFHPSLMSNMWERIINLSACLA